MTVCKYYLAGRCRYGKDCKFEHVGPTNSKPSNSNRPDNSRPLWPLTVIAIAESHHTGNVSGNDISPEELRVLAYDSAPRGQGQHVTDRENQLLASNNRPQSQSEAPNGTSHQALGDSQVPNDPFRYSDATNHNGDMASGMDFAANPFSSLPQPNMPTNNMYPTTLQNQNQSVQTAPDQLQNSIVDPQFTTSQFTFENVPETAPLPQFY